MLAVQLITALYVHSFVFLTSCHRFYPVWCGNCGFLEMMKLACGDRARDICGMHRDGALREDCLWTGSKMKTWCQAWVAQDFMLCANRTPPLEGPTDAKTGGPALGSVDAVLLASACCRMDAGAATAAMT
jgi:hypothetical protein